MRTLVVSDLHLGARGGRVRLADSACRAALVDAVSQSERLVLLGDLVEFRDGPMRDALATASRVLLELGGALGPGREVVIVPGNHDHHLLAGWLARRAAAAPPPPLGLESAVEWMPSDALASVAGWLAAGGASVRAAYPGVWLRDDVYATHGHYLDRHTTVPFIERLGAGAMARLLRRPAAAAAAAEDYEAVLAPLYAWMHAIAQAAAPGEGPGGVSGRLWAALDFGARRGGVRPRAARAGVGAAVALLNRAGLGPLHADLSGVELRRAGVTAFSDVLAALGIRAPFAIFGHTHRAGPLPVDGPGEWVASSGSRLLNTGCWVHEPAFLGSRPSESPYRAGFAVRIDDDAPPELVNLLG